jgi:dihydrofolate reductase
MKTQLVVAHDLNNGIGHNNDLPWPKIPEDMRHFKNETKGNKELDRPAIVMGRKTWESLGEYSPLPGRLNIVVSRNPNLVLPQGVLLADSLKTALQLAIDSHCTLTSVIGGAQIYSEALALGSVDTLKITVVNSIYPADTFLEDYKTRFTQDPQSETIKSELVTIRFETWHRK